MPAFVSGNSAARKHGANSPAQIVRVARGQKRRLLRQIGLRAADLDGVALALLDNWSRAQSKVELLDRWLAEHGVVQEDGEPTPPMKIYFTALNCSRLAATRLAEHLRERHDPAPLAVLEGEGRRLRLAAEQEGRAS